MLCLKNPSLSAVIKIFCKMFLCLKTTWILLLCIMWNGDQDSFFSMQCTTVELSLDSSNINLSFCFWTFLFQWLLFKKSFFFPLQIFSYFNFCSFVLSLFLEVYVFNLFFILKTILAFLDFFTFHVYIIL